jgi:hypothetical protein
MNVTGPTSVAGANTSSLSALSSIPADIRTTLTTIAETAGLTESDRTTLTRATSIASGIADSSLRAVALRQISGLGLYLGSVGNTTLPRWSVMTALRAYGLNLRENAPTQNDSTRTAEVLRQVAELAKANDTTVAQAIAQVPGGGQGYTPKLTPLQSKNAAVIAGLNAAEDDSSAASLTSSMFNRLV